MRAWVLLSAVLWYLTGVGWQRNSERTEKGFIYGNPGHPGNKDLFTRRVCPKSRGSVALLRFFPRREMEQTFIERILCALHFPKVVASFHPYSDATTPQLNHLT